MLLTEMLNVEHGVFLAQLSLLERLAEEGASEEVLAAAVRTLGRAVENHRDVEEEFLYPAMARAMPEGCPPLHVMDQEHRLIERVIGAAQSGRLSSAPARSLIDVLRSHIAKEIQILFPLAEQTLGVKALETMTRDAVRFIHERAGVPDEGPAKEEIETGTGD